MAFSSSLYYFNSQTPEPCLFVFDKNVGSTKKNHMKDSTILVTGAAGFIGSHLVDRLLTEGFGVVGVDNFNDYYDPKIKERNLESALQFKSFRLYREDILNIGGLTQIFKSERPEKAVHLAARTGVRPSILDPHLYGQVNILGTVNLLKLAVNFNVKQFIFGSSSSVYGQSKRLPFAENDPCNNIISPYGASKRAAEFFVESFSKTYGLRSVILRLFTVYGPRGRPDMAPALFTKAILSNKPINQFGNGSTSRDYTYIDDIINGIVRTIDKLPRAKSPRYCPKSLHERAEYPSEVCIRSGIHPQTKSPRYSASEYKNFDFEIINLGNNHPVTLTEFISTLEKVIGKKAKIKKLPIQSGDVEKTWVEISKAQKLLSWLPKIAFREGLQNYLNWYKSFHQ